ncbi:MAG: dipeptide epimerase [Balneola sp.]|jgi:L-alanine-DL-glutamate epimerase-like enolase superfamily enzyme|nr:dipeptide epimerase [Balneola sp.]MBE80859.1 dipeptide epimerase [Balneola sp.]|tara:strand:+ start:37 stop:1068 length:1032 start_codon:yes stop_codon:yes gene_type:complete
MSRFEINWEVIPLKLKEVFTISRGSKSEVPNVFLSITKNGITGYGEAGPNTRYDETADKVIQYLEALPEGFFDSISSADEIATELEVLKISPNVQSAKAAIEMAWMDWWGKSKEQPLWKLWGNDLPVGPVTSYTIGLDTPEKMQQKIRAADQYPVYKIKLGTDRDREIIEAIRDVTDKPLRVDANEGWTTLEQARKEIEFLSSQNVELIEQPMPAKEFDQMKELKKWSPLPLAADESFIGDENLAQISEAFHIINIKLMKIGSLVKARNVIKEAHQLGLEVMIGCMIESSLANAAGALLALDAEYADLDGHLLISNDTFSELQVNKDGKVILSNLPGLGVDRN